MKTLVRKKTNKQPCKSPSPDIANRSIIKNTTIEVEDIRIKFKRAQEKQFKFQIESSISQIPSDHASQTKYRLLYEEFNILKNYNKNLIEQNKLLNQSDGRFQDYVPKMTASGFNNDDERKFVIYSNNMLSNYQSRVRNYFNELDSRINKVEMMQKILKEKQDRWEQQNRVNKTPLAKNGLNYGGISTAVKIDTQKKDYPSNQQRPLANFQQSSSPFITQDSVIDRLEREIFNLQEIIKFKDSEILRMNIQRQRLNAIIRDYERNKKGFVSTPTFNNVEGTFKTIAMLQDDLKQARQQNQLNLQINQQLNQKLAYLQKLGQGARDMVSKLQYQQNKIKQFEWQTGQVRQCLRCVQLEQQNTSLKQKLKQTTEQYDTNCQKLKNGRLLFESQQQRMKNMYQSTSQSKFKQLEDSYKKLEASNNELSADIKDYLGMLEYVKSILHIDEILDLLTQNSDIYAEVEATVLQERERRDNEIKEYEYKIRFKDFEIAELERDCKLKATEVDLLKDEIKKLKAQNLDVPFAKLSSQIKPSNHTIFFGNSNSILEKIKTGSQKLEILYQKMNNTVEPDVSPSIIDI